MYSNSSLPLPSFSQTLTYQPGNCCTELCSARSQQPDLSQEPWVSESKSLMPNIMNNVNKFYEQEKHLHHQTFVCTKVHKTKQTQRQRIVGSISGFTISVKLTVNQEENPFWFLCFRLEFGLKSHSVSEKVRIRFSFLVFGYRCEKPAQKRKENRKNKTKQKMKSETNSSDHC